MSKIYFFSIFLVCKQALLFGQAKQAVRGVSFLLAALTCSRNSTKWTACLQGKVFALIALGPPHVNFDIWPRPSFTAQEMEGTPLQLVQTTVGSYHSPFPFCYTTHLKTDRPHHRDLFVPNLFPNRLNVNSSPSTQMRQQMIKRQGNQLNSLSSRRQFFRGKGSNFEDLPSCVFPAPSIRTDQNKFCSCVLCRLPAQCCYQLNDAII